jgi:energy-coupling factor transporter ATP-binding protein EcfA2
MVTDLSIEPLSVMWIFGEGDVEFAARAADRVVVMAEGEIVADGLPPKSSSPHPSSPRRWRKSWHRSPTSRSTSGVRSPPRRGRLVIERVATAIRITPRAGLVIAMAALLGLVAFFWPFLVAPRKFGSNNASGPVAEVATARQTFVAIEADGRPRPVPDLVVPDTD